MVESRVPRRDRSARCPRRPALGVPQCGNARPPPVPPENCSARIAPTAPDLRMYYCAVDPQLATLLLQSALSVKSSYRLHMPVRRAASPGPIRNVAPGPGRRLCARLCLGDGRAELVYLWVWSRARSEPPQPAAIRQADPHCISAVHRPFPPLSRITPARSGRGRPRDTRGEWAVHEPRHCRTVSFRTVPDQRQPAAGNPLAFGYEAAGVVETMGGDVPPSRPGTT